MLPDPEDAPPSGPEPGGLTAVALPVLRQFRQPVVLVGLRKRRVFRAAVPEAPIDEHRDL
jgi:hypothetical protein